MIKVYHAEPDKNDPLAWLRPDADKVAALWGAGGYQLVASVDSNDLDEAWRRTNSIDNDWYESRDIIAHVLPCRSSMVGDVFILDGQAYLVASLGFEKIEIAVPD